MNDIPKDSQEKSIAILVITAENFEAQVLKKSFTQLVLVDFWAGWCNPCKMLMPVLENLADDYTNRCCFVKIDTEKEKSLAEKFNIRSLPTVKIFKLGDVIDEFNGVLPDASIREIINKHLFTDTDVQFHSAMTALETKDQDKARSILEDILSKNSTHANSILLLARIELLHGNNQAVDSLLKQLPIQNTEDESVQEIKTLNNFSKEITGIKDIKMLFQNAENSDDTLLQFQLACYFALNKDYEKALAYFIKIMKKDRKFKDDAAKKNILAIFDLLGGSGPLVNIYRIKMSRLLH